MFNFLYLIGYILSSKKFSGKLNQIVVADVAVVVVAVVVVVNAVETAANSFFFFVRRW